MEHASGNAAPRPRPAPRGLSSPRWRLVAEGAPILVPLITVGLVVGRAFPPAAPVLFLVVGATALTFRDPERAVTHRPDVALAPADGRIIHIGRVWDTYWQAELIEIAMFLAIWDLHIQRSPLDGEVVAQCRRTGGYRPAMSRAATHGNNQLATYVRSDAGPCVVTQISGLLARRIVSWTAPGTWLAQGERLGMIKFGSQTTLRLPTTMTVLVDVGDRVRAGLTPVARLAASESPPTEL